MRMRGEQVRVDHVTGTGRHWPSAVICSVQVVRIIIIVYSLRVIKEVSK